MTAFLEKIADFLVNESAYPPGETTIIFPNKRASLFFKQFLLNKLSSTSWMPVIYSIEEAVARWTSCNLADKLVLRFMLLETYLELQQGNIEGFTEFSAWADEFLRDFDDIDLHLVDADALYQYLSETKAIELWHADGSELSDYELNYLAFYKSIKTYYTAFSAKLEASNIAYPGMLFRKAAKKSENEWIETITEKQVIFAGFNALTPAEQQIIVRLIHLKKARIFWDLDTYYVDENAFGFHEAGHFARLFKQKYPGIPQQWVGNRLLTEAKNIRITGVPGNVAQAKAAGDLITKLITSNQFDPGKTALVLADENLLIPMINAIPESVGQYNVTMGIPLQLSPVYQTVLQFINMHIATAEQWGGKGYDTGMVLKLIASPVWQSVRYLMPGIEAFRRQALKESHARLQWLTLLEFAENSFCEGFTDFVGLLFEPCLPSPERLLKRSYELLQYLAVNSIGSSSPGQALLTGNIEAAVRLINKLLLLEQNHPDLLDTKSLLRLIRQSAPSFHVSFYGEPLLGMQLMGLLETRNLDFDRVILLSANEGILPARKNNASFIPHDIRHSFGLPVHTEKQATYAYHFFRLMQSASNIHVFYNTEPDLLEGGEKSRFLMQITEELAKLNPRLHLSEHVASLAVGSHGFGQEILIPKTTGILQMLREKASAGFSPTSISNYILCPLKFYLKDVLRIKAPDSFDDQLGFDLLGKVVHLALTLLYQPLINLPLTPDMILKLLEKYPEAVIEAFRQEHKLSMVETGKNRLLAEVVNRFVKQFLQLELERIKKDNMRITIESLEEELKTSIIHQGQPVLIKGTPDRIERRDGVLSIIDYKTGKVETKHLTIKQWEEAITDSNKAKALQLGMYILLYCKNFPMAASWKVEGEILAFKDIQSRFQPVSFPENETAEGISQQIELQLSILFDELFDEAVPFQQTNDVKKCTFCEFMVLCSRNKSESIY
ncbi:MAG: PD-(D/E)XK nuclease family protein [Bacteroidetes bacterium]|nr:PD-(D/E)XK nuclease family protein [Bacteroidota bacterium]